MTGRRSFDVAIVRCGPGGHWLAGLYRGRDGCLWIRYEPRRMLDPQDFRVIPSPRPGGHVDSSGVAHAPFLGTDDDESTLVLACGRCRHFPMWAQSWELLRAAAAGRAGKPQTVIAVPSMALRESRMPPG